jgi:hypothetical protein
MIKYLRGAILAALIGAAASSCGGAATSQGIPGVQSPGTLAPVTNSSGWRVSATVQPLEAGATVVTVTVAVKGPATIYGGCEPTVHAQFVDAAGNPVATAAAPGVHCLAIAVIQIAPGQTRTFTTQINAPTAPGHYTIRTTVNSKPPTQLPDLKFS